MMKKILSFTAFIIAAFGVNAQNLHFDKLIVQDGLTSINSILIDRFGFSWFGGTHGLYRFDGTNFMAFNHNPEDNTSLSSDNLISLFEDSDGVLWIGSENNGINLFNPEIEKIQRLQFEDVSLNESSISAIGQDKEGNIWLGTVGNGIYVLDSDLDIVNRYLYDIDNPKGISGNTVFDFFLDSQNRFWITTNSGKLDLFKDNGFEKFEFHKHPLNGVRTGQRMAEGQNGKIWIGTEGQGLFIFNPEKNTFETYSTSTPHSQLRSNVITDISNDSMGNIWLSTDGGGVNQHNVKSGTFNLFQYETTNEFGLSNNASYSLAIDRNDRVWLGMGDGVVNISTQTPFHFLRPSNGLSFRVVVDMIFDENENLWAGTGGGGLTKFEQGLNSSTQFNIISTPGITSDIILSVMEDKAGDIWTGTFLGGINCIRQSDNSIESFTTSDGLSNNHVFDIVQDANDQLWIATQGGGLNRFDLGTNKFKHFTSKNGSGLINDRIQCLLVDEQQRLWIGFYRGGIQILNIDDESIVDTLVIPSELAVLFAQYPIHTIYEAPNNNIWIGTGGLGLIRISGKDNFKIFNKKSGIPSNSIYGVLVVNDTAWISTNKGIASMDLATNEIMVLNKKDGILTSDFESGSIARSSDNNLFFSSKEGVLFFNPDHLKKDLESIDLVFTDLAVFNQKVSPRESYDDVVIIEKSITVSEQMKLPFSHNNFTIYFNAPSFSKPLKLKYRYRLKGLESDWVYGERNQHFVPYSNLNDGNYTFMVQGSLDGKRWSNTKLISISIFPPIYRSWYAYVFYALTGLIIIFIVNRLIMLRIDFKNQLKFEKYTRKKDSEINQQKTNFFTNISHELRTPLTLLIGPIEQLINDQGLNNRMRNQIMIMQKNANRLFLLINQLMNFRKMESGKMKLQVSEQDIVSFMEEIVLTFRELALQKQIQLNFINKLTVSSFYFDEGKLEIALYNLLSNAVKFTNPNGEIIISINQSINKENLIIKVADNGNGISAESLDKIFEPFYRDRTMDKNERGTGIGLSLVKNVIEIHRGTIHVDSQVGKGSDFTITIPGIQSFYNSDELMVEPDNTKKLEVDLDNTSINDNLNTEEHPILLIVEDNKGIIEFLRDSLSSSFQIHEAVDGQLGLEQALNIIPDIIISDIMMPVMDGIEMCRHLKTDIRTSHIPIILLTARTGYTHELLGLDTGADNYLTKPFQIKLLLARLNNLLENRKKLRDKVKKEILLEPSKLASSDPDEKFLSDLMKYIEQNISDSEYTVKDLARQMGISHSVLYRKIIALTNLSINDFIKSIRLKRAAQLLEKRNHNITEISYMVGFSNPKYFSICFKQEFKKSPSEYIAEQSDS